MEAAFKDKDKDEVLFRLEERTGGQELECEDALHRACGLGWLDVAGIIISKYDVTPDIAEFFGSKLRPIHVAAKEGQTEAIDLLLLAGANKEGEDIRGNTALHYAFENKQWDTAEYLINKVNCDPRNKNVDGIPALVVGLENASTPTELGRVIETYANLKESLVSIPYWVLEKIWTKDWKDEIVHLAKVELVQTQQDNHVPIIVAIAGAGNIEMLEFLLEQTEIDLSVTDMNGNNALLISLQNGHKEVAEMVIKRAPNLVVVTNHKGESPVRFATHKGLIDIVKCLVENGADSNQPDCNGNTPLASAIRDNRKEMTEYLVRELQCDLGHKNKNGRSPFADGLTSAFYAKNAKDCIWLLKLGLETNERAKASAMVPSDALHLACKNRMLDVVELLVQGYNCNPILPVPSIGGQSVLHKVFENKDVEIASFLLAHKTCPSTLSFSNGPTLLELATGNDKLRSLLNQCNNAFVCQARKPMKVFVVGNPYNGKTSLVKLLRSSIDHDPFLGSLRTARSKPSTTGISPYRIQHRDFGSIVLYDCAGREQYRSYLAAVLEKFVRKSPAIFIVVVDIDQKKEEIVKELLHWTYFINCVTGKSPGQSHVIIAGSKADHSSLNHWGFQNCCTSWINEDLNNLVFGGAIMLDCHKLQSRSLTDLIAILSQSCATLRSENPFKIQFQHLVLYAFCMEEMQSNTFTIAELKQRMLEKQENTHFLPNGSEIFSCLQILHDKGLILYLEKEEDKENGVVVIDLALLLRRSLGQLLAPPSDKHYLPLNVDTGLIPLSHFRQLLCNDPEILSLFLQQFNLGTPLQQNDDALFVPVLAKKDKLEINNLVTRNDGYWFGMLSEFKLEHSHLHFIDHYLYSLQLEVMKWLSKRSNLKEGAPANSYDSDIWKNGIHWRNDDQVECLMELSPDRKTFLFLIACSPGQQIQLVFCRSKMFRIINETRERFFKQYSSNIIDSIVPGPDFQQYPNITTDGICKAPLSEIRQAVFERQSSVEFTAIAVIGKHSTKVSLDMKLNDLLYFDSCWDVPSNLLASLLKAQTNSPNEVIPSSLLKQFAAIFIEITRTCRNVLAILELNADEIDYILSTEADDSIQRLVYKWTAHVIMPCQLIAVLEQLTIFEPLEIELACKQ